MGTAPLMHRDQRDAKVCGWAAGVSQKQSVPMGTDLLPRMRSGCMRWRFWGQGAGQVNGVPMGTESGGQRQALSTPAVQGRPAGPWPMKKSGAGLAGGEAGWALQP